MTVTVVSPGEEITADHINKKLEAPIQTDEIGDYQITSVKIATGEVKTANIGDGAVTNAKIGDYEITSNKIATGEVKVTNFAAHLGEIGPVPDVATWYATPYTLPSAPSNAIVTPTNTGVMGYVQVASLATTGVQLVANVSGVTANVTLIL